MAKKKPASYLSPRKILPTDEYEQYKQQQIETRRAELQKKLQQGEKNLKRFKAQQKYSKSRTGRFGALLTRGFQAARRPNAVSTALYSRSIPITSQNVQQEYPTMPRTLKGTSGGRVGRPKGTYDLRYKNFGGVYGYRKMLAAKLRAERIQLQARATISPQQQMVMNQMAARQAYAQQNPENKIIPDTSGYSPTGNFNQEIDIFSNLVP